MASKKEIETLSLHRFKELLLDFPAGLVEPTEEPDFLVRGHTAVVGVEVTELHQEAPRGTIPLQAAQAMRRRIVAHAQAIFGAKELPPVHATVFLGDTIAIRKSDEDELAVAISDIVQRCLPAPNSSAEHKNWDEDAPFPDIIHHINVYRLDQLTRSFFTCPGATWVAHLTVDDVERCLVAKEPKYPIYRQRCDEAWLLIDVDTTTMSTWFEFEEGPLQWRYLSSFDRVFLLRHFGNHMHELLVAKTG